MTTVSTLMDDHLPEACNSWKINSAQNPIFAELVMCSDSRYGTVRVAPEKKGSYQRELFYIFVFEYNTCNSWPQ